MRSSRGLLVVVGYAAAAVLLGFILIQLDLPDQFLVVLLVPPVVASVNNPRILYLSMAAIFLAVSVWVAGELALEFDRSLRTVLGAFLSVVATCEAVGWLAVRRRLAEKELRDSEQRYRELVENANDIIYTHDLAGRLTSLNRAGQVITGYAAEEAASLRADQIMPEEYRELARKMIDEKLSRKVPTQYEVEIIAKDGHRISMEVSTRLIYKDGRPVGVQGIARDISERKQAEAQAARLAAAVEYAAEAIVITDVDGTIQYVNPAFEKVTGYRRREVLGKNPNILKSGKHDEPFYKKLWDTIQGGAIWSGRFTNKKKDGTFFEEEATISPVYNASGTIVSYVGVKRNITEELALEAQLRHAQKMEAVGQLAGGVAHDFNNLLQGIQGYASLAMLDLTPEQKSYERMTEIVAAVERGGTLVRQLLTFSRREAIHPRNLDLNKLIGAIMEMLRRVIGEHIELSVVPGHELQIVCADPVQIEQILLNLCVNARDAMPDGGQIVIETENIEIGRAFCQRHPWAQMGDYVLLSVRDTGRGIPAEIREHIFEPFFTTKELDKGTGLGLATVYGIVKQHEGLINVYSEMGDGTVFKIYMPVAEPGADATEAVEERVAAPGGSETILLAEDEEFVRDAAVQILEEAGYTVLVACDGKEAADLVEARADEIDLALLDVVMPRMGGPAVFDRIRGLGVKIPVLFSSGYSFKALEAGDSPKEPLQLIQKPYKPEELLIRVRELLDKA